MKWRIVKSSVARDTAQMPDLTNPKLIKLKGVLFLLMGILSSVLLLIRPRTLTMPTTTTSSSASATLHARPRLPNCYGMRTIFSEGTEAIAAR